MTEKPYLPQVPRPEDKNMYQWFIEVWKKLGKAGSLLGSIRFGSQDSYTGFDEDGTMQAYGDATCWDDIVGSLVASQLNSVAGKLDYNWAENSITMNPSGDPANQADRLIFNFQVPHAAKLSEMRLHIHWEQTNTTVRTFRVDYRLQNNGAAKTTAWTTVIRSTGGSYDKFTYTSGTLNQITRLVEVDLSSAMLSTTVQFRLTRTDSNAGDVEATFVDAHVERDTLGSRTEYTK